MQTLVINIEDDINIGDFFSNVKNLYPSLKIIQPNKNDAIFKRFAGTSDLKSIYADSFKMYPREELYDR